MTILWNCFAVIGIWYMVALFHLSIFFLFCKITLKSNNPQTERQGDEMEKTYKIKTWSAKKYTVDSEDGKERLCTTPYHSIAIAVLDFSLESEMKTHHETEIAKLTEDETEDETEDDSEE